MSVGPSCWATGISSLITGSAFWANVCRSAIVIRCSLRKVGNTWKVCSRKFDTWAVVWKVVSPAVIRLLQGGRVAVERVERRAAVADQRDDSVVLDVEHLEQLGQVDREHRQVARARC